MTPPTGIIIWTLAEVRVNYALPMERTTIQIPTRNLKIIRTGNTWEVWDTEGDYYRFGGTDGFDPICI